MSEPERHPRRRADDRAEVRLPRSLVISFVVSFAVLVIVGLLGIVVTNKRAGDAAVDSTDTAKCLLLQALEQRAFTYAADQAAADFHGYDYDDLLPADARPPDLNAVMRELADACEQLVPAALLQVPEVPASTTVPPSVIVVPGEDGSDGAPGAPGPAGPASPATTAPGGSPGTTAPPGGSTTTTSQPFLPPITLPIAYRAADPYAAGMSVTASWLGAGLIAGLFLLAVIRSGRGPRT